MIVKTTSGTILGLETRLVRVEIAFSYKNRHNFTIVGMADKAVLESKKRILSALRSFVDLDNLDIMVNLAPAQIKKVGSHFDLAIAVGILKYCGVIKSSDRFLEETLWLGELSLDGNVNEVPYIMGMILDAPRLGCKRVCLPIHNYAKAKGSATIPMVGISSISELITALNDPLWQQQEIDIKSEPKESSFKDFASIKGQRLAKRMLQISAAGGHNSLLVGPPGCGKTLLAQALMSIMPPLSVEQSMECARIYAVSQDSSSMHMTSERPFRNPHYGISPAGIIGGGSPVRPGEISLAHNGVLFLDELTEFKRGAIESLRQPLEDRVVTVSRAHGSLTVPASFILLAAMNPCPCGNLGDNKRRCSCSALSTYSYLHKISGPFLDRIDMQIFLNTVALEDIHQEEIGWSSADLYKGVEQARISQKNRYNSDAFTNSMLPSDEINIHCKLQPSSKTLLDTAFDKFNMSMRSYHKILRVSRTIADIEGSVDIQEQHLKESLMYRGIEHKLMLLKKKI